MRRRLAGLCAALFAALVVSGCIGTDEDPLRPIGEVIPGFTGYTWPAPVAYNASLGSQVTSTVWDAPETPRFMEALIPGSGAEPNIGVTASGAVFVTSGENVLRSLDQGVTWEVVHDFVSPNAPQTEDQWDSADPMLWVDRDTDRLYVSHMYPAIYCTYLAWSDDEGATWTERPFFCATTYLDHQKIMTAPHGPAASAQAHAAVDQDYPNVLYMCYNKIQFGTWCAMSHDGGLSIAYETQLVPFDQLCGAINGHPAAFPDGTVAVAMGGFGGGNRCGRPVTVAVTEDDGVTWAERSCSWDHRQAEIDPDITVTPDGTAYLLFRNVEDQMVYLMRSTDKFVTCDVFRVSPEDHTLNVFTVIQAGDDGMLTMAYLGTTDAQDLNPIPSTARQGSVWHLYVTTTRNADAEEPIFHTQQTTPHEDPIQIGCVWLSGGGGGAFGCRNLLDFIDMTIDDEGRVYVAVTDGCTPRRGCAGTPQFAGDQSQDRQVAVFVHASGASLFDASSLLAPVDLAWPLPDEEPVRDDV